MKIGKIAEPILKRSVLKYLKPNEIAEFEITNFEEKFDALEYCNIHGLWRNNDD